MKKEDFLFGCNKIKEFFSGLISENILSHAYLIEGPEGSGKKSLAKYIAASLACGGNCNDCNICHRIAEGHCPDIKFISRSEGQKNISVDAVRAALLRHSLSLFDRGRTVDEDVKAVLRQLFRDCRANAAGTAGYDC